jgi:hypothetical protein
MSMHLYKHMGILAFILLSHILLSSAAVGVCTGRPAPMVGVRCVSCDGASSHSVWFDTESSGCEDLLPSFMIECSCAQNFPPGLDAAHFARMWAGGPWAQPVCCPTTSGYYVDWDVTDQCQSIICSYAKPPCTPTELEPCDGDLP